MMGLTVPDLDVPILKNTNAVLAFGEKDAALPPETACIRCGSCLRACPMKLMPVEIERAYEKRDGALLKKLKVNLCFECGCCAYVCPARRPLVQINKLAKGVLAAYNAAQKAAAEKAEKEAEKV
jgi:electron transport complex protein RnfC